MSGKKTITDDELWILFYNSAEDFETTPEETMIDKVCSLYINEFNYWRHYDCSNAVWKLDRSRYRGLNKQQVAGRIRNDLQSRMEQRSWAILKAWEYVSQLLDETYTWFE